MKRLIGWIGAVILGFFPAGNACAQAEVSLVFSGKDKGTVASYQENGITYVDLQKTARKLGAGVELFAQSKQAKITAKGFYSILTAPLPEIIINASSHKLPAPVQVNGGKMMVPVSFFLLPSFQRAVEKTISFDQNKLFVERYFSLERTENLLNEKDTLLVFRPTSAVSWDISQPNKHTVLVTFPGISVKRDEHFRLKTDFISSVDIRQNQKNVVMKVILGKAAKDWSFTEQEGALVFRAGAAKAPPILKPVSNTPVLKPAAPVSFEPSAETVPAQPEKPVGHSLFSPTEKPSVLVPADDFEEMQLLPAEGPVIKPAEPAKKTTPPVKKEAPVIKAEPHPLAIVPAHKKMRIVIDPGHGGKDPGAVRSRYREKNWNLDVAKELAKLLKKGGFEVKMTRNDDSFLALAERSKISNNFKADLFVSIHTNASKNKKAHGFQVYFRSEKATDKEAAEVAALENEAMQYEEVHYNFVDVLLQSLAKNEYINESSKLAGYVRNAVYKQPGIGIAVNQNSSVRQANFYVLKGVNSPAVLVEMGYISSTKDRARLATASVRDRMAKAIYTGIRNYAQKEGWIH